MQASVFIQHIIDQSFDHHRKNLVREARLGENASPVKPRYRLPSARQWAMFEETGSVFHLPKEIPPGRRHQRWQRIKHGPILFNQFFLPI
jgi:hypothetical protein